ncbi:hypothetical protein MTsPCn9_30670 [Croceitalea sp. MTPC9]|uniref:M56 family metallopeptidase n=1 Tax=unclassified Croceitalea TaxID=2632280 RepID=UPI002B3F14E6|nr:hypothetical protein MTsPCn6_20980 [Croceitalea sp. MTPC6]GMN18127.1 hypothetical protein MTsPCn9_30670 [Croceitalea sp. MTPC9]
MEPFFIHLIKSSSILLLFLLSYYLFLRKETFFNGNRLFLVSGLITAIFLPFVTITKTILVAPTPLAQNDYYIIEEVASDANVTSSFNWVAVLMIVYLLGVLYFSFKLIIQLSTIRKIKKTSDIIADDYFYHVKTKKQISPFSFFKHIFYYPKQFEGAELKTIIEHEKVHARELHSIDILITEILFIVLWFNPIIWFYKNIIKQNLEFLADAKTCAQNLDKKNYQYLMLRQALGNHHISIANPFYNSIIKKRIVMLNQNQSKSVNRLKLLLVLPFLGLFLYGFNTKEVVKFSEAPISQTIESEQNPMLANPIKTTETEVSKPKKTPTKNSNYVKTIELKIDKNTTDESLEKMKSDLAKDGADFSYTVVRNSSKEIIDISIQISGKGTNGKKFNGNYNTSSDTPINPITILYDDKSNAVSFWNSKSTFNTFGKNKSSNSMVWIDSGEDGDNPKQIEIKKINGKKIIIVDGEEVDEEELEDMNIFHNDDGSSKKMKFFINSESDEDKEGSEDVFIIENDDNSVSKIKVSSASSKDGKKKPLIYIDGEKATKKQMADIKSNKIESVHVLKGTSAKEKYGALGSDGVVEVTTKNNKNIIVFENSNDENEENKNVFVIRADEAGDYDNDIKIRSKGPKPLYIVDGKEVKKLKNTSPDEIESINVLKGKAARKKYGKKGKNGVVEIITKKN